METKLELLEIEKADEVFEVKKVFTTTELLNVEKEDFEFLITELHKLYEVLENVFITEAKETQKRFLKELQNELNWNECRLDEVKQSILIQNEGHSE